MLDWIIKNKDWLFSGVAVTIPMAPISWFFSRLFKSDISTAQQNMDGGNYLANKKNKSIWSSFKVYGLAFVAIGIAIFLIMPSYAIYAHKVHWMIGVFLFVALSVGIVMITISCYNQYFPSYKPIVHITSRLVLLFCCVILLCSAHARFNSQLTEFACQNNFWPFYRKVLSNYGIIFILTHVYGVVFICFVSIISFMGLLYYFAVMNYCRTNDDFREEAWHDAAKSIEFFYGWRCFFISALLLLIATCLWVAIPYNANVISNKKNVINNDFYKYNLEVIY
ncbi:MAG: hypothetical protein D3908_08600 [Candidatus Electrothrix sp. AUS4]|nr:hypothetical protein [Candidatus Electrothrix sp. AUS4]